MNYDDWKLMTPEENAGLKSVDIRVTVTIETPRECYETIWSGMAGVGDVEKRDWDDEDNAYAVFPYTFDTAIWISGADEEYEINEKVENETANTVYGTGDCYLNYENIKYKKI